MKNYEKAAVGKRIRLLAEMVNPDSSWMPKESLPIGLEGTITYLNLQGDQDFDQIGVNWDNGRSLAIFPYLDEYEIIG